MGNKPKKPQSKLLFEINVPPLENQQSSLRNPEKPNKPHLINPTETTDQLSGEFDSTFSFCLKTQRIFDVSEPQLHLTQSNSLFLNYSSYKTHEFSKIQSFLSHSQLIQIHAYLEYYQGMQALMKQTLFSISKSMEMSPIQRRNSNREEEFKTPSPLKSEYARPETLLNHANVKIPDPPNLSGRRTPKTLEVDRSPNNESQFRKNNEETQKRSLFLKPNFVHLSKQLEVQESSEEKIQRSLTKIDKKLNKLSYYLRQKKEKSTEDTVYLELDLWKMSKKPNYTELSGKKLNKTMKSSFKYEEVESLGYNVRENKLIPPKKPINANKQLHIQSDYSQDNLKKYLNKSHSDFSPNQKYLAEKKDPSPEMNYAENRANFLYMNYDISKSQHHRSRKNMEKENLELSLIDLKKSMNLPENSKKVIKKPVEKEETAKDPLESKVNELERLRRSLALSQQSRFSQQKLS